MVTRAAHPRLIRRARRLGARILRRGARVLEGPPPGDYIAAAPTVAAARAAGQTVEQYVEDLWGGQGGTAAIVDRMAAAGALEHADTVVEIGAGTGRYVARVHKLVKPRRHVVYETAEDWRAWLAKEYAVEAPPAGERMAEVDRADLVHAHGVFVYTPFLVTASYLAEIERLEPAWVVFDFYATSEFDHEVVNDWLASEHRYPVVLDRAWVLEQLPRYGVVDEWTQPHGMGRSRYLILRRRG